MLSPLASGLLVQPNALAWGVDLASHWQWLFMLLLLVSGGVCAAADRRWGAALCALPLPFMLAAPSAEGGTGAPVLVVASANLHMDNIDAAPLAAWLASEKPDVVVLLEVGHGMASRLERFADYPHRFLQPRDDPFGIGILSRLPLASAKAVRDSDGIVHIDAQIESQRQVVTLVAVHPMPPISAHFHGARNARLRSFAERAVREPLIVAGDLNATPWSSAFAGLQPGLRRATGLLPTWPASMQGWMGIPIDHVLVSEHFRVVEVKRGPAIPPADHLPVVAHLRWK